MNIGQLQSRLFEEIRERIPKHVSMADTLAELLKISNDSAYRRIRGDKTITLEELQKLSLHFDLSIDRLLHLPQKAFLFQGHLMDEGSYDIQRWLTNLRELANHILLQPAPHIYYLAKDVPFVYPLQFPELAAFKDFFRKRSLLPPSRVRGAKFSVSDIDRSFSDTAAEIVKVYNAIPSTEIWSSESLNSIIKQIRFYQYTGQFASEKDAERLFDIIEVMIGHLEHQAETGVKFLYGESFGENAAVFNLYNNELFIGEDTILVDLGNSKMTFLNHIVINYMTSTDEALGDYTFKAIQNIISRSTPVSWVGEKDRSIFFNGLKNKLAVARATIYASRGTPGPVYF